MEQNVWQSVKNEYVVLRDKPSWQRLLLVLLIAGAAASILFSFAVGYYSIPLHVIWETLTSGAKDSAEYTVLMQVRLPRILSAFVVGAALSVSGAAYQGMFRNPLVSPDILGVASGAGLGASVAIFWHMGTAATQLLAFAAGLAVAFLAYAVSLKARFGQTVSLILAGTMMGALCVAATSMLKYLASPDDTLPAITFWLMGSLAKTNWDGLLFSSPAIAAGFVVLYLMRWRLNVLTLPDAEAQSVGLDPRRTRVVSILAATLLCAGAVCIGGLVGWVGLMIPHIARGLTGPQYRRMLPVSFLLGGIFLILADDACRSIAAMEIPLGVLTAFLGAPFFLVLILRRQEGAS